MKDSMTVEQVQHLLGFLGHYQGAIRDEWGREAQAACRAFQQQAGLAADGIPGPKTQQALRQAVARKRQGDPWQKTPNFTRSEFACKCGCGFDQIDLELVALCQKLRDRFGGPVVISSGCRCPEHNRRVGGKVNSRHLLGRAVDFSVSGHPAAEVLPLARQLGGIRYAYQIDEHYLHMDIG